MPRFRIRKAAEADIDAAFAWYEAQREGLGLDSPRSRPHWRRFSAPQTCFPKSIGIFDEHWCVSFRTQFSTSVHHSVSPSLPASMLGGILGVGNHVANAFW